jgi:hypothetical protein
MRDSALSIPALLAAFLLSACSAATVGPSTAGPTASPGAADSPTASPTASQPASAGAADGSLGELVPDELGGSAVIAQGASGSEILALLPDADTEELEQVLGGMRSSLASLSVVVGTVSDPAASGGAQALRMLALRVTGVQFMPGSGGQTNLIGSLLGHLDGERVGYATIGGKNITTIFDPADPVAIRYVHIVGDALVVAEGSPSLAEEFFASLPSR